MKKFFFLIVFIGILIFSGLLLKMVNNTKQPEITKIYFCDSSGTSFDQNQFELNIESQIYICGYFDSNKNWTLDSRLYNNLDMERDFIYQENIINPGNFQFDLFSDYDWINQEYFIVIFHNRDRVFEGTLSFSDEK